MPSSVFDSFAEDFPGAASKLRELGVGKTRVAPKTTKTPTGVLRLDAALRGGLPSDITEICGPDSVGKTALLGRIIAQSQARGLPVFLCFGDYLDHRYLEALGVDTKDLGVIPGGRGDFEETLYEIAKIPTPVLLAVDSMTSVRPLQDFDGQWIETWSRILQMMKTTLKPGSAFIAVSQVRMRNPRVSRALKSSARQIDGLFATSLHLAKHSVGELEYTMVVDIKKSATSVPGVVLELPATKGFGIQYHLDAVRLGKEVGVLEVRGPNVYFKDRRIGAGEYGAAESVMRNPVLYGELLEAVLG